jgi:hypothetical protein
MRANLLRFILLAIGVPAGLLVAGCGGGVATANPSNSTFSISPGTASIDTNCTGCNGANGSPVEQFSATLKSGGAATVTWSQSPTGTTYGSIDPNSGQYTPPGYLTSNSVQVTVTAALTSNPSVTASAVLTVTPGFLQPLTPENVALGAGKTVTVTGYIAEAGGTLGINYSLSNTANGSSGGQGSLSTPNCTRGTQSFTFCTVTYTAPSSISATGDTYIVGTIGSSSSRASSVVLLNTAGPGGVGVTSNPATHETELSAPVKLGSSGGNDKDYDTTTQNGQTYISDCCGGTLGSLIKDSSGNQYILSNNHVMARSDQAAVGEPIVQPGLIDDNCTPFGQSGAAVTEVGALTGFLSLKSASTNADAAIAAVNSGAVDPSGSILELGTLGSDGTLAAAPPGTSSTGGKGENPSVNMTVAKSGRTTGLTCASISAINLSVSVDYFTDCAETKSYTSKIYSNQIGITGNQFSDAGDSGSLVVDAGNAEPVGLFFAGGVNSSGVSEGVANPAPDVLSELSSQVGNGTTYTFVGTTDHPVSCLNYGNATASAAQATTLTPAETTRAQQALGTARMLVSPSTGILGVATGKSSDHTGEGAVIVYVSPNANVNVPATINGVRTLVVPTTASAVADGSAPLIPEEANTIPALAGTVLNQAIATKEQLAPGLMQSRAFFGVGVGQSLDNPKEAVLVIYVDRHQIPAQLPPIIGGMRTRYVIMDRLHVTRSYAAPIQSRSHCMAHPAPKTASFDAFGLKNQSKLRLP